MNIHPQLKAEAINEGLKAAPPVAVNVMSAPVSTDPLQHWVLIGTLAYLGLQAAWLLWKWWKASSTKGWTPHDE